MNSQEGTSRQRIHRCRRQQVSCKRGLPRERPIKSVCQRTGDDADAEPPDPVARRQQNEERPDDVELFFNAQAPGVAEHPRRPRILERVPEVREIKRVPCPAVTTSDVPDVAGLGAVATKLYAKFLRASPMLCGPCQKPTARSLFG